MEPTKVILCGNVPIPDTTRKRFRFNGQPNPNPFYCFKSYTLKQLMFIQKKLSIERYNDDLKQRLKSENKYIQFIHDLEYYINKAQEMLKISN